MSAPIKDWAEKNVFPKMVGFERPDGKMTVVVTNRHTVTPINVVRFPNPLDSVGEPDYNVLVTKTSTSSVSLTAL